MKVTIAEHERIGGITQADIEKIRKKVKIGDKIRVWTLKAVDAESVGSRTKAFRRGTVIAKFPRFAVVEFAGGVQDSVLWIDLIKGMKR